MLVKKYFDFTFPGEKLLIILVIFFVIVFLPYFAVIFSVIASGSELENLDLVSSFRLLAGVYAWVFFVLLASVLLRIYILKKFIQAFKYHQDNFDFTGSIWKFLWICVRDGILSAASFGIYYSWFMENIANFIFSNIKYLGESFSFMSKGGELLKIFLIYYIVPMGLYYYYYYTVIFFEMVDADLSNIWNLYLQLFGTLLIVYILLIPFWYKALKWLVNLEFQGRDIQIYDDSWSSLGIIAREMIITLATFGIYFPAAMVRLYIYFVSHIGISGSTGVNFLRFDEIPVSKGFKYIWGQLLLSMISWWIYYPFALCKIIKWFSTKTYLLVYQEEEVVPEQLPEIEPESELQES